ncbi:MAG: histidine kinase [Proteobacteria bacterium]|nr:histidine kinase [Pseudomonadota bacterium]
MIPPAEDRWPVVGSRGPTLSPWWPTILVVAPPCWLFVFLVEITNMEAWRVASSEIQIAPPATHAVQFLLLLPLLLLACRAAAALWEHTDVWLLRIGGQVLVGVAFAALARPALVTAAAVMHQGDIVEAVAASMLSPSRESLAIWVASAAAMALNYAACLGIVAGVKTYRDLESERVARADVEREAVQARLQALTNQLNPHFLFNVLNTIVSLIGSQPRLAQTLVTRFAELLRRILNEGATRFVPLARELELAEQYLEIQQMRFPSRLRHSVVVDEPARAALVPALVLQPLIENAVIHGLRASEAQVQVEVRARIAAHALEITVVNQGSVVPPGVSGPTPGVGLRNVGERLRTLFGDDASVVLAMPEPGRYVAIVHLPVLADGLAQTERAA